MGNNFSYTIVEEIIVTMYDANTLTLQNLDIICNVFRGTDIDSGGSQDLETKDGKFFEQVAVELVKPDFKPDETDPNDPWGYGEEFGEISSNRWGWR